MATLRVLETNLYPVLDLAGALGIVRTQALVADAVVDASGGVAVTNVENDSAMLCGALSAREKCASGVGDETLRVAFAAERRRGVDFVD